MLAAGGAGVSEGQGGALPRTAVIHSTRGDIHVKLFPEQCAKTVENWTTHSRNGYYDGVIFHRVIKGFMLQTGDPLGEAHALTSHPWQSISATVLTHGHIALRHCLDRKVVNCHMSSSYVFVASACLVHLYTPFCVLRIWVGMRYASPLILSARLHTKPKGAYEWHVSHGMSSCALTCTLFA